MKWYKLALSKYSEFEGRSRRKEYWMFFLFNVIFSIVCGILDSIFGTFTEDKQIGLIGTLYSIFVLVPGLSVGVRRLHDVGKSGWMIFILLIPIIGWIWFFILMVREGDHGDNEYGPDPKQDAEIH